MSSAASARLPGAPHEEPQFTSSKEQSKARALGLTSATGLVIGSIIGTECLAANAAAAAAGRAA